MLTSLCIRDQSLRKPKTHYPNAPVTLLPKWCKGCIEEYYCTDDSETKKTTRFGKWIAKETTKFRKWIAKWYSKVWFIDDYSTSGANISDAIKSPPVGISV